MIDTKELRRLAQAATPGPWKAGQYLGSPRQFVIHTDVGDGGRGSYVAFTSAAFGNDETIANARLIAAAPDLLEACETFAEWLGREERGFVRAGNKRDTPEGERAWRDWYNENLRLCALAQEQARAAIARATGEQP